MDESIVIVGDGIAAINAIKAIREVRADIPIDLYGEEKYYPYNRIRLSKSLFDQLHEENILLQKKDWYDANKINLHLNVHIQGIDPACHEIVLPNNRRKKYGKLLIATGAFNIPPAIQGGTPDRLDTIRTLEDVHKLHRDIMEKNTILNIGGGIQGLETAWILHQNQKKAIIVEIQPRLFPYQLDERSSDVLKNRVEEVGIKVFTHTEVVRIIGERAMEGVMTRDGIFIPCEAMLYAIGIRPNIEIVQGTLIKTHRGILVNERMETNVEDIYAAGDGAEFEGKIFGLWNIAIEQGKTAGYNMVNQPAQYRPVVPVTTLNAYGVSLFSMGNVAEEYADLTIVNEDISRNTYKRVFIRDHHVVGAIVIGDISKSPVLKTAIEKKLPLDDVDLENQDVDKLLDRIKNIHR